MAAITAEQRAELVALFLTMFGQAPTTTQLARMVTARENGTSLLNIGISASVILEDEFALVASMDAESFADYLADALLASDIPASAREWAENWVVTNVNSNKSKAQVIVEAVQAIRATTNTNYASSKAELAADVTATLNGIDNPIVTPSTFTLSTSIDAGAKFTGTGGNDTFIGDAATASLADQLVGGAGIDTLRLFGAAVEPTHTGIEIIELTGNTSGFTVSDNADVQQLILIDPTTAQSYGIANGQNVSVSQMASGEVIDFTGNTVTALNLTVNGLAGAGVTVDLNSIAQTSLNIISEGKGSTIVLQNTGNKLATVSVTGDQAVTVNADTNAVLLTTLDASAATGKVTAIFDDATAKNITAIGGAANDTFNFGALFTNGDKVNGGAGNDTLQITAASVAVVNAYTVAADKDAVNANIDSIEVLKVTDALAAAVDATRFDNINSYVFGGAFTSTLSNVASGVSVQLDVTGNNATVAIKDASLAGNNSDVLSLILNDTTGTPAGVDFGTVKAEGADVLNINSTTTFGTVTTPGTGTNTLAIDAASNALDKIVVTGNVGVDLDGTALVSSIQEIDASGMTVAAANAGLAVAIATGGSNGVKITGSSGIDTIVGGDGADIINGGAGNDKITGGLGNDILTGGAGNDTFNLAANATISSSAFDTITDYSNGTTVGASDTLDFAGGAAVGVTAMGGWTLNTGVMTKAGATLDDFITAVQANSLANEVYAFVSGSDTYVFSDGATTATTDDVLVKLVGVVGSAVVTADTVVANEILIA